VIPRTLADFDSPYVTHGDERVYEVCPVCGNTNSKVSVNMRSGKWNCFARQHGGGGVIEVDGWTSEALAQLDTLLSEVSPPAPEWTEVDLPTWVPLSMAARRYLQRRGIADETIRYLGIVEHALTPRVLIPFYGRQRRIISYTARAFCSSLDNEPKYVNPPGPKPPLVLPAWDRFDEMVLVEGPLDAINVWQSTGRPVMAIGGVTLSRRIVMDLDQLIQRKVVVMLDGEALANSIDICNELMHRYQFRLVPLDWGVDPGELSEQELKARLA